MEVGTARERVLIALFMYVFGKENVDLPTSSYEYVHVCKRPVSIKTKMGKYNTGVKIVWTVDWLKIEEFYETYEPACDLLFVQIDWDTYEGGFYLMPLGIQSAILEKVGKRNYLKLPTKGTNPRGVELAGEAMKLLKNHPDTLSLPIVWRKDTSLLVERAPYGRWIQLWDGL